MKRLKEIIFESNDTNKWYHGSASGDLRGGSSGLHLGTYKAAKQALEARIGVPAEGEWDGTREYGKTKLAGNKTLTRLGPYNKTGHNCHSMEDDYYPHEYKGGAFDEKGSKLKYADGTLMPHTVKPSIKAYKIIGAMTNTPERPHSDIKANALMTGSIKKGNAKRGYYYKNEGEDAGSVSVVVPNGSHVKEIV
jgi:hypothetical protein